jgi:ABC-type transport system substrate-binding protein
MSHSRVFVRLWTTSAFLVAGLLVAEGTTFPLAAQQAKTPGQKKEEEEVPGRTPRKPPPRVGDEETAPQPKRSQSRSTLAATDLGREAQQTRNLKLRALYLSLARPHDVVIQASSGRPWRVEPIPEYFGTGSPSKTQTFIPFNDQWERSKQQLTLTPREISRVESYEEIVLKAVKDFLLSDLDKRQEDSPLHLSRLEMIQEAEKILTTVIRYHKEAVEQGRRRGEGWQNVELALDAELRTVRLAELRTLSGSQDWTAAFALADQLREDYPKDRAVQVEAAKLLARQAQQPLNAGDFTQASQRLRILEDQLPPDSPELVTLRNKLRNKATELMKEAEDLVKSNKTPEAIARLEMAEKIDRRLPGLHDFYVRLTTQVYPVLYVGVPDFPEKDPWPADNLWPGKAITDAEKQATDLMFESLLTLTYNREIGERYLPDLAPELPRQVPLGRVFPLVRNAYWSNGKQLTATDVRSTVTNLSKPSWPGYIPQWAEIMHNGARTEGDAFHIRLNMHQGYLDPLSLMDFKVLPENVQLDKPPVGPPIGSGPFQFKEKTGAEAIFVANPYYEARSRQEALPKIREIRLFHSQQPLVDFQNGHLQLLIQPNPRELKTLGTVQGVNVLGPLHNRRIYFLAVNHRHGSLQTVELRRALAHAIDREKILNAVFRGDGMANFHRPLNGPYPPGSWACAPPTQIKPDPFDSERAKNLAEQAKQLLGGYPRLTLKYPDDDPDVATACQAIRDQVQALTHITLDLQARAPRDLWADVQESHDFDLAYYHWDYPSEAYWLWPLFDPRATERGGLNFLGYTNDSALEQLFRKTMARRDFARVQDFTYQVHRHLYDMMPLIPLWQLDSFVAVHDSLKTSGDFDPAHIFSGVEKWTLEKR